MPDRRGEIVNATITIDGHEVATCDLSYVEKPRDIELDLARPTPFSMRTTSTLSAGEFHYITQQLPPPEPQWLRVVRDGRYFAGMAEGFRETPEGFSARFDLGPASAGCSLCGQGRLYSSSSRASLALSTRWKRHRCSRGALLRAEAKP